MTQSEIASRFDAIQQSLKPKLFQETIVPPAPSTGVSELLQEILNYDAAICETAFGSFGTKLYETAKDLDFDHPDLKSGRFLSADEGTFKKMIQFLRLCLLAEQNNLHDISPIFSKCVTKALLPDVKNSLDFLKNQQQYVRLFKSAEDRHRFRKFKQIRPIEYASALKRVGGMWSNISDLEVYSRFGNYYESQIASLQQRIEVYQQYRLPALATDLMESLTEFKQGFGDAYYGFQRVPISIAALVLGKMHNCYLTDKNEIMMPATNFGDLRFEAEAVTRFGIDGTGIDPKIEDFHYMPMAYPIYSSDIPEETQKVLNHLENFPEANGKPIFDHYIAIVPGVHYPRQLLINEKYFVYDAEGKKHFFQDMPSTRIFLDAMLIREKKIFPAVLGERDGKCYFIGLWG